MKQAQTSVPRPHLNGHKKGNRQGEEAAGSSGAVAEPANKPGILEGNQIDNDESEASARAPRRFVEGSMMTFSFNGRPIRAKQSGEAAWFVAADLCIQLDHSDTSKAVSRLEDDEKGATIVRTPGGEQELLVINESGLYALIFSSRKPEAKAFRRWVTTEVLPSIRKTGPYDRAEGDGKRHQDERGDVNVVLPHEGCFVVAMRPGGSPYVQETGYYDGTWRQVDATDCRILCNALRTIEAFWQKTSLLQSCGVDLKDGFALEKLEESIRQGGALAQRYLRGYDDYRDETPSGDDGTPPVRRR